jgi:hypothetical protein
MKGEIMSQHILKPGGGQNISIKVEQGNILQFRDDFDGASFERPDAADGTKSPDLLIRYENGGSMTLENFFQAREGTLPTLRLSDGTEVNGADFLAAMNSGIEFSTAAGPGAGAGANAGSGGAGEYSDDPGSLIGGIDRFDSLGTDYWARASAIAEAYVPSAPTMSETGDSSLGDPGRPPFGGGRRFIAASGDNLEINEACLPNGSDGDGETFPSYPLTFKITSNDGFASVVVNGVTYPVKDGGLVGFTQIDGENGFFSDALVTAVANGAWTLTLNYTQITATTHEVPGERDMKEDAERLELSVLSRSGASVPLTSSVNIIDDAPAELELDDPSDTLAFVENAYAAEEGSVTCNYGADGFKSVTIADSAGNGKSVTFSASEYDDQEEITKEIVYKNEGMLSVTVTPSGQVSYVYRPASATDSHGHSFTVTAEDGDGDTVSQVFEVAVNAFTPTELAFDSCVFDESYLQNGTARSENDGEEQEDVLANTLTTIIIPDGYSLNTSGWTVDEIDGSLTLSDSCGAGVFTYSGGALTYTLKTASTHDDVTDGNELLMPSGSPLSQELSFTHTATGKTATGVFTYNILDDGISEVSIESVSLSFEQVLPVYDIVLCIDTSLSMLYTTSGDVYPGNKDSNITKFEYGDTRLYAIQVAALNMLKAYADQAGKENVHVVLTTFNSDSQSSGASVLNYEAAVAKLSCLYNGLKVALDAQGNGTVTQDPHATAFDPPAVGTNYTAGLNAMKVALETLITADTDGDHQLRAYFMSDGRPQAMGGGQNTNGIDGDKSLWHDYRDEVLSDMDNFRLNVVGIAGSNENLPDLGKIDGSQGTSDVIYIPRDAIAAEYIDALVSTVGIEGSLPMPHGVDGVFVASVALAGINGEEISDPAPYIPEGDTDFALDEVSGKSVGEIFVNGQIIKLPYGDFTFYADGTYMFAPDADAVNGGKEGVPPIASLDADVAYTFTITYRDGDGDTLEKTFTYTLERPDMVSPDAQTAPLAEQAAHTADAAAFSLTDGFDLSSLVGIIDEAELSGDLGLHFSSPAGGGPFGGWQAGGDYHGMPFFLASAYHGDGAYGHARHAGRTTALPDWDRGFEPSDDSAAPVQPLARLSGLPFDDLLDDGEEKSVDAVLGDGVIRTEDGAEYFSVTLTVNHQHMRDATAAVQSGDHDIAASSEAQAELLRHMAINNFGG